LQLVAAVTFCVTAAVFLRLNSGVWSISPDSTVYVEGARSLARLAEAMGTARRPDTMSSLRRSMRSSFDRLARELNSVRARVPGGDHCPAAGRSFTRKPSLNV